MISRRNFGLLLGSTLVSLSPKLSLADALAPLAPLPTTLPKHPFLGLQYTTDGTVRTVRVRYDPPQALSAEEIAKLFTTSTGTVPLVGMQEMCVVRRLSIDIQKIKPAIPVKTIDEAEDIFFESVWRLDPTTMVTFEPRKIRPSGDWICDDGYHALAILINRQANLIAARTRRTAGNTVLMHPEKIDYLRESPTSAFVSAPRDGLCGLASWYVDKPRFGWTTAGVLNHSMNVYMSPKMRKDRIVVVYQNQTYDWMDGPATVVLNENGEMRMALLEANENSLGTFADYCGVLAV